MSTVSAPAAEAVAGLCSPCPQCSGEQPTRLLPAGQLGHGNRDTATVPTLVEQFRGEGGQVLQAHQVTVTSVAAGNDHTAVVDGRCRGRGCVRCRW